MSELAEAKAKAWDTQAELKKLTEEYERTTKEWQDKANVKKRELDELQRQANAALEGIRKRIDEAIIAQHKADGVVEYLTPQ